MPTGPAELDAGVREELARAFQQLRPQMIANARADADLDPASRIAEFGDADLEQFLNAYEGLFNEALEGGSRQVRELVFETALPPILELGQTSLDMARGNVISAVLLSHRLLPLVSTEHREDAARWLASFYGNYVYELLERARALEAKRG